MQTSTSALDERVPPFRALHRGEQLMLAVSIAAGEMGRRVEDHLRSREPVLTHTRYNALRILRGAAGTGLSCSDIGGRLLLSPPDVTRLIDPLVDRGLVTRAPDPADRRVVLQRLTVAGEELLADLDKQLSTVYDAISSGLGPELADRLVDGCERLIAVARGLEGATDETAPAGTAG